MANSLSLSALPDPVLLEAVAAELGVDPSFVEKDWHATQAIAAIVGVVQDGLRPVFSGGTSLSKGYGLIRRFSEDLDFKLLISEAGIGRTERRSYRNAVIETLRAGGGRTLHDSDILVRNEGRFFQCRIGYPTNFDPASALRPEIRLEMSLLRPALPPEERPLRSLVAATRKEAEEVPLAACVAPAETAADKLSALTWRVLTRQRGGANDDPTLVRHLHDLAALEAHATDHSRFAELSRRTLDADAARERPRPDRRERTPAARVAAALDIISTDPEYADEYGRFVAAMSYGTEADTPKFRDAVQSVRRIAELLD